MSNTKRKTLESQNRYTVCIITALPIELAAVLATMDERHKEPPDFRKFCLDSNPYELGNIGGHNVVVTLLQNGSYGKVSAATTANAMLASFPWIRIGLMVGIGGAVSRPGNHHDIRLGDVVVSRPEGVSGGVVQYDLGKAKGGSFEHVGFLAKPPSVLLGAIGRLQARYILDGSTLPTLLDEMMHRWPQLAKPPCGYTHQGSDNDRLFKTNYAHPTGAGSCSDCHSTHEVSRSVRVATHPEVHYGVIASGDTLMKEAGQRDAVVASLKSQYSVDCLCFEMEAAGLMNNFPCLVIRGISDYCDSHKNDRWQKYAAATAAAYAKELLSVVQPEDVKDTPLARTVLETLSTIKKELTEVTTMVKRTESNTEALVVSERDKDFDLWLSSPNPSQNRVKAIENRHVETGKWFLQGELFENWKMGTVPFLWLHGNSGCGKTVLSSAIIEDLLRHEVSSSETILYFFFDFRDTRKQSLDDVTRSLVSQLYGKSPISRPQLLVLYKSCRRGKEQPTTESLMQTFLTTVGQAGRVKIVLDALDEASTTQPLLQFIERVRRTASVIVTSQRERNIEMALTQWLKIPGIVAIQNSLVDEDIKKFVQDKIRHGDEFRRWQEQPDVLEQIENTLMEKAGGMFRWAACQIEELAKCPDLDTLEDTLASLPESLDETYARTLRKMPPTLKVKATRLLQFLIFSPRPMRLQEIVDAIAINPDKNPPFDRKRRIQSPKNILMLCSSLLAITTREPEGWCFDEDDAEVEELQLAHSSVKTYLLSDRVLTGLKQDFKEIDAKATIVRSCLAYLSQPSLVVSRSDLGKEFPFLHYATICWFECASAVEKHDQSLRDEIQAAFLERTTVFKAWITHFPPRYPGTQPDEQWAVHNDSVTALYYAALGGLSNTITALLDSHADPNTQMDEWVTRFRYSNALQAAAGQGHLEATRLLLDAGADILSFRDAGYRYYCALHAAVGEGHLDVVELLLKRGADVDQALIAAAYAGDAAVTQFLMGKGAEVQVALGIASEFADEFLVRILLDHDANPNEQNQIAGSALIRATKAEHLETMQLLLDRGADVNAQSGEFGDALQVAASNVNLAAVQLLLSKGANVNARGGKHGNALRAAEAALSEHADKLAVVQVLLDRGADVHAQAGPHGTALRVAEYPSDTSIAPSATECPGSASAYTSLLGRILGRKWRRT